MFNCMKTRMQRALLFIFLQSIFVLTNAQAKDGKEPKDNKEHGVVAGKVIDKKSGEGLIGVTIMLEGTAQGASTDYEGKYNIANVKPGTYNVVASYVSYNKKIVKGVEVKSRESAIVDVLLEEETKELKEVVVSAEYKKESANALLIQQKNLSAVS